MNYAPPSAPEAERSVLGCILHDPRVLDGLSGLLAAEDFEDPKHQDVFRSAATLHGRGERVDLVTVAHALRQAKRLEGLGGQAALAALWDAAVAPSHYEAHARLVADTAALRRLVLACRDVVIGSGQVTDVADHVDRAEATLMAALRKSRRGRAVHVREGIAMVFERLKSVAEAGVRATGVTTGIRELDRLTSGLHPTDLIILAGRPGTGKTSYALNVASRAATRDVGVAIFSLEMSTEQLMNRLLSAEASVPHTAIRNAQVSGDDFERLTSAGAFFAERNMWIDDRGALPILELRAEARRLHTEHAIGLVVVDYLQLIRAPQIGRGNREQEIAFISQSLKALAKELGVPVLALSQLNRQSENRPDKRPQMSDLRESGAIEQDADLIMFIYRDELYNRDTDKKGVAEIIIGKQRNGPTGVVECRFFHEYTKFADLTKEYGE